MQATWSSALTEGGPIARIRHIAILANDPNPLAAFYVSTFGMTEVMRMPEDDAVYVSDGHLNLAIIKARGRPEGMFHFGFQVDDMNGTAEAALRNGALAGLQDVPLDGRFVEAFIKDPGGNRVDVSETGWKIHP
jgi:catechol 2,3-dioxygenase-like lactoylglutathione lyase family enzyme